MIDNVAMSEKTWEKVRELEPSAAHLAWKDRVVVITNENVPDGTLVLRRGSRIVEIRELI